MKILFLILGFLALLYLLLVFLVSPSAKKHPDLLKIKGKYIAHRGLHDEHIPENSLASFRTATEQGLPIEIDLHLIRDGNVVVFHDDNLKRMCGSDEKIADITLSELKKFHLAGTDETIPTLQECLNTVDGKTPLLIEFKMENGNTRALCRAADQILSEYKGDYLIQSFFPQILRWYKVHRKTICRGQLSCKFHKKGIAKWMLGNQLLNFIGRPHFVSYKHSDATNPMFLLTKWLGAFPVGWTFRSKKELKANDKYFQSWIFENTSPTKKA